MSDYKNVLIVEDNVENRRMLCRVLSNDYRILSAENGEDALAILREKHESISAVLLNVVLPVLDGYEVLMQMREDANLSKIPVIVIGEQHTEEAEVRALSLGAIDYVLKPYKPAVIKRRIANTIYLRETASIVNSFRYDKLTGLYSKEYFYLCVSEIIHKNPEKHYDIICSDIERFKLVNDLYGSEIGDKLLQYTAKTFEKACAGHGICGRIGVDIFGFLIEHPTHYSTEVFAKEIEYINRFSVNLNIMIRYGIYNIDDIETPVNIMVDRACLAKDSIKGKYNAYFAHYDDHIRQKLLSEELITSRMKMALEKDQFKIYCQAKYDLKTGEVVGAEALVRWIHPEKGLMYPNEFIPLFEKNGFITDLDVYIWECCCQRMRAWIDKGNTVTPISVNVSRTDIYNPQLVDILVSMIQKYKLSTQYLHLEITETAYTENPEQLIAVVQKLKKHGFVIEMDDFGTGYSSLNMLSELPIDVLKLDIKFIQNESAKKNSRSILSFIVSIAKWLKLVVVAEGVETESQARLLASLGCEYAQGYFYTKPLECKDFEQLLLKSKIQKLNPTPEKTKNAQEKEEIFDNSKNMLIVENGFSDAQVFQQFFGNRFQVLEADGIPEAIAFIHKLQHEITVLILSMTPEITSQQLEKLQNECKLYRIPVLTIHSSLEGVKDALALGTSDYILRPYMIDALENRIENAMFRSQITQFQKEKEINQAVFEMRKRVEQDSLTGLLNRAEFEVRIREFLCHNQNPKSVFIILDIDNFKNLNDNFGHITGDSVLCTVAAALNSVFKETNMISRIGGDEFAVFVPYADDLNVLQIKLKKLCDALSFNVENLPVSCSVGACTFPDGGKDYESLYNNADIALLAAKRNGKRRYEIFQTGMALPSRGPMGEKAALLMDDVSDAVFVSDAVTSEIIYLNDVAAELVSKEKNMCLGAKCYQIFWDRCHSCDRCVQVNSDTNGFYEEDAMLKDNCTKVHLKIKVGNWEGRGVKIHYLSLYDSLQ